MRFLSWARCLMYTLFLNASKKYRGADGIKTTSHPGDCIYTDRDGNKYNITTIRYSNGCARFKEYSDEGCKYYFNPCISFTLGPSEVTKQCQQDVAICKCKDMSCWKIGTQSSVQFNIDKRTKIPALHYSSGRVWKSTVLLKCDVNDEGGTFRVADWHEASDVLLNLTHKCACPNACLSESSTTKDPTPIPSGQTDNIVIKVVLASVVGLVALIVVAIVIWQRRRRRNDQYPPLLDDNRDPVDDVSENHFPDGSEGSELTSGRGSASFGSLTKPFSSGSSCNDIKVPNKKDDLNSKIKTYTEDLC